MSVDRFVPALALSLAFALGCNVEPEDDGFVDPTMADGSDDSPPMRTACAEFAECLVTALDECGSAWRYEADCADDPTLEVCDTAASDPEPCIMECTEMMPETTSADRELAVEMRRCDAGARSPEEDEECAPLVQGCGLS